MRNLISFLAIFAFVFGAYAQNPAPLPNGVYIGKASIPATGVKDGVMYYNETMDSLFIRRLGVWEALALQKDAGESITIDPTVIDGSPNPPSGNAVFDELALKADVSSLSNYALLVGGPTTQEFGQNINRFTNVEIEGALIFPDVIESSFSMHWNAGDSDKFQAYSSSGKRLIYDDALDEWLIDLDRILTTADGTGGGDGLGPDGNVGDLTIGGSGTTATINSGAVTSAKILDGTIDILDVDAGISASLGLGDNSLQKNTTANGLTSTFFYGELVGGTGITLNPVTDSAILKAGVTSLGTTVEFIMEPDAIRTTGYSIAEIDAVGALAIPTVDWVNSKKVSGSIAGRTGTTIDAVMIQTSAQIIADGAPAADEVVFCSDCSPAEVVASATITMDGWKMYDDQTADAATITLSDCEPGESLTVYINRASAPALAGTGLTFNQLPNTTAFASATEMAIYFQVTANSTTIDYFYFER